jgi:hypothetical protein
MGGGEQRLLRMWSSNDNLCPPVPWRHDVEDHAVNHAGDNICNPVMPHY